MEHHALLDGPSATHYDDAISLLDKLAQIESIGHESISVSQSSFICWQHGIDPKQMPNIEDTNHPELLLAHFLADEGQMACVLLLPGPASSNGCRLIAIRRHNPLYRNHQAAWPGPKSVLKATVVLCLALSALWLFFSGHAWSVFRLTDAEHRAAAGTSSTSATPHRWWLRYDTSGSSGPRYNLNLHHDNVTAWTSSTDYQSRNWTVRLDDQSVIPSELMDEEEERYQAFLRRTHPEWEAVVRNQRHLDPNWLHDPEAILMHSDYDFHTSHCIRVFKRYWQAKETGKHVCPRDIDYRHMKHCFDALENVLYPDGSSEAAPEGYMVWQTKACF